MNVKKIQSPEWKQRLQPFGELYSDMNDALCARLESMTDNELKQLVSDCDELTHSNCWWAVFAIGEEVRGEARRILRVRQESTAQA